MSAQGPLVLGFGAFGLRVLGLGLTIIYVELVNVDPLSGPKEPLFIASLHCMHYTTCKDKTYIFNDLISELNKKYVDTSNI